MRDLLVREIPTVLRTELYAVAALTGQLLWSSAGHCNSRCMGASIAGAVLCFVVRYVAIRRAWRLPVACPIDLPERETDVNR